MDSRAPQSCDPTAVQCAFYNRKKNTQKGGEGEGGEDGGEEGGEGGEVGEGGNTR